MVPRCRKARLILVLCLAFLAGSLMPVIAPAGAVPCDQPLPVNNERASEILATMRPFEPANPDLFYSAEHPAWRDSPPVDFVDGPALSEDETEAALKAFLERRFPCDPDRVYDGLAIFTDPSPA